MPIIIHCRDSLRSQFEVISANSLLLQYRLTTQVHFFYNGDEENVYNFVYNGVGIIVGGRTPSFNDPSL